ncbi:MAG: oxidoreductase [Oleiphilus sp.]|nr:MAG: oxidoreductase [Oleiphilus sp.]
MSLESVYLFGTCLIDAYYPEAGLAAVQLLEKCGLKVVYPQEQTCCGQPPFNSGFPRQSVAIAKKTIAMFSREELPVIVPSASCAGMIKRHYPSLMHDDSIWHQRAQGLAERTCELIDFLLDRLPFDQLKQAPRQVVALHQSCSALRETDSAKNWRTLLERMPNVEARLPQYAEECCGFGGTFSIKSPQVSLAMTADKCEHLMNTGANTIVSGDCGCLLSLSGYARQHKRHFEAQHLACFIAQQFEQVNTL